MIERRPISSLFGLAVTFRDPVPTKNADEQNAYTRNDVLIVRKDNGAIVATVSRDDLFDRDGNLFGDE